MPKLIVMVGLPGSGKDFMIENRLKISDGEWYIASTDAIIEEYAASVGKTYSEVFDGQVKLATKRMEKEVQEAIKAGKNVIWNQTNMAATKRAKILSKFPKDRYERIAIVVMVDEDIHNERLRKRAELTGKSIPAFVIKNMRDQYVKPTLEEGFDDILFVDNSV